MNRRNVQCLFLLTIALLAFSPPANAGSPVTSVIGTRETASHRTLSLSPPAHAGSRVASVTGIKETARHRTIVHIHVDVSGGVDPDLVIGQALQAFGARRLTAIDLQGSKFLPTGLAWSQYFNRGRRDDVVVQHYNPTGDPTGGGGIMALQNAQATWNGVRSSRFRFALGGTTARTPTGADGFNDVAWMTPPPDVSHRAVAVTLSNFVIETLEFVDADVLISPSFRWTTDGSGHDIETALLHELGHALGLDHISDATSIMYPDLPSGKVQRNLGADDIDGVTFLYPRNPNKPLPSVDPSALYQFVAQLDYPTPSQKAFWVDQFEPGALNARGEIAFVSSLAGRCISFGSVCYDATGQGVFMARKGLVSQVAATPQDAPGDRFGRQLNLGTLGRAALNDHGDVAFAFDLMGESLFPPFGTGAGIIRYDSKKEALESIVLPDQTPATGCVLPPGLPCVFFGAIEADINNKGDVAFGGLIPSERGNNGVFVARRNGGIVKVVSPGDSAPGGVFDYASSPSINDAGDVAFDAHRSGEECIAAGNDCLSSIYLWRSGSGRIEPIARQGAPAPGRGTFRFAANPVLNNRGEILFGGDLTPAPGWGHDVGLFLFSGGAVVPVVRPGDPLPGGGNLLRASVSAGFGWPEYWLSDNGKVAFTATLDSDTDDDGIFDTGVYLWDGRATRLVARSGTVVPGEGVIFHVQPPCCIGAARTLGGALVNSRGHVLFQATLTNGRTVLLVADAPTAFAAITAMTPNSIVAGTTSAVVIAGSNLKGTTGVLLSRPEHLTVTIEKTAADSVRLRIEAAAVARPGERQLALVTPSGVSNALTFEVISRLPFIDSVSPPSAAPGSSVNIVISGINLGRVNLLQITPSDGITVTNLQAAPTEVRATGSVAAGAGLGRRQLVVSGPDGTSNELAFGILIPPPPR